MAEIYSITDRHEPEAHALRALSTGDGGSTYDGMEARVARLEEDAKEMKADLKAIRVDLAYLRGKIAQYCPLRTHGAK